MKISISSDPLLSKIGPEYFFSLASEAGIDGVDLSLNFFDWQQIKNRDFSSILFDYDKSIEYAEMIDEYCRKYDMEILQTHAPFPTWYEGYPDEVNAKLTQSLINCIHITKAVGSKYLIVHPYFYSFSSDRQNTNPEIQHELNMKMYGNLIPALKETGVICCSENMWLPERRFIGKGNIYSAMCENPYEVNKLIGDLNELAGEELFGFCLDTGHCLLSGYDPCKVISLIAPTIKTFHIHDNNGIDDEHVYPYMGITDWDRFCKAVKDMGFKGHLNFEVGGCFDRFTPDALKRDKAMDIASFRMIMTAGKMFVEKITGEPYKKEGKE
ncbi:MAG: sugar phosphate isomerase/epimerase [Clostridiales bacterium]|nr:sugar phosphate isomerase/epimerase [Clostridiales bacterium]